MAMRRHRGWVRVGCVAIGVLWIASALSKIHSLPDFADTISRYALFPSSSVKFLAAYVPLLEIVLGLGLWIPIFRRGALVGSLTVLGLFTAVLITGDHQTDCGCMGALMRFSSTYAIIRNLCLMPLVFILFVQMGRIDLYNDTYCQLRLCRAARTAQKMGNLRTHH